MLDGQMVLEICGSSSTAHTLHAQLAHRHASIQWPTSGIRLQTKKLPGAVLVSVWIAQQLLAPGQEVIFVSHTGAGVNKWTLHGGGEGRAGYRGWITGCF